MRSSRHVEKKARVWTLDIHGAAETVASLVHAGYRHRAPARLTQAGSRRDWGGKTWKTQRSPVRRIDRGTLWPLIVSQLVLFAW